MGSGVIYAAIVVAWASVLIPRWLRRYDESHDGATGHGFSRAMRVLSRHEEPAPERARQTRSLLDSEPDSELASGRSRQRPAGQSAGDSARRQGRARLAARRRRLLLVLLITTTVVALLGVVELVPPWTAAIPAALLLSYVVHLRVQTRHESELARRRYAARERIEARMRRIDSAERVVAARRERDEERAVAQFGAERLQAETDAYAEAERLAEKAAGWEPRESPLPTYVTKPRAGARTIDVSSRGSWTAQQASRPDAGAAAGTELPMTVPTVPTVPTEGPAEGLVEGPAEPPAEPPAEAPAEGVADGVAGGPAEQLDEALQPAEEFVEHRRVVND